MMNKINGNTSYTAILDGGDGVVILAFYEKPEYIGTLEKAVGAIEFSSWEKYREFVILQGTVFSRLDRNFKKSARSIASGS